MTLIITLFAFVIALGMLILVHEMGHYWVARWNGVKVLRFSIGFGKPLFVWRAGQDQTEWALSVFPLGGYVKMLDEREGAVPEAEAHRAFNRQNVWRRIAIVAAGPAANMLFAVLIYWCMFVVGVQELSPRLSLAGYSEEEVTAARIAGIQNGDLVLDVNGEAVKSWSELRWVLLRQVVDGQSAVLRIRTMDGREVFRTLDLSGVNIEAQNQDFIETAGLLPWLPPAVIGRVNEGGAAERAGLRVGDEVISVDGEKVRSWRHFVSLILRAPEQMLQLEVRRDNQILDIVAHPEAVTEKGQRIGRLGVEVASTFEHAEVMTTVSYGVVDSLSRAVRKTWETTILSVRMIGRMLTGQVSWRNLSGPVTIADYAGKSARMGLDQYLLFVAIISISLGIMNLLPIPVLDGGLLLYYLIEVLRGRPVSERTMETGLKIGLALLMMLMALAFYNDITRIVSG